MPHVTEHGVNDSHVPHSGQGPVSQGTNSLLGPGQSVTFLPFLHSRVLVLFPGPQVTVQGPNGDHGVHIGQSPRKQLFSCTSSGINGSGVGVTCLKSSLVQKSPIKDSALPFSSLPLSRSTRRCSAYDLSVHSTHHHRRQGTHFGWISALSFSSLRSSTTGDGARFPRKPRRSMDDKKANQNRLPWTPFGTARRKLAAFLFTLRTKARLSCLAVRISSVAVPRPKSYAAAAGSRTRAPFFPRLPGLTSDVSARLLLRGCSYKSTAVVQKEALFAPFTYQYNSWQYCRFGFGFGYRRR